jgi:serine O-acetyltransferase
MEYLIEDLNRYFRNANTLWAKIKAIVLTQGIWATIVFRCGSWCHRNKKRLKFPGVMLPFLTILQKMIEIMTGITLPFTATIGKGLYIGHHSGIIIGPDIVIGSYCNISQGVTIGQAGRGGVQKVPMIGDRVYIGPGAKIFGDIKVGNDVAIGANAVVTKSLNNSAVAVGVPAKVVSYNGSGDFVIYDKSR